MYVSYFEFFGELKSVANDLQIDFNLEKHSSGEFDAAYNNIIDRLVSRCKNHSKEYCNEKSKLIAEFISDIRETKTYPQSDRFKRLFDVIDIYIRKAV